ncbi:hypothetical protein CPHO_03600 [Corynebacterium phocae]|uniref:Uncharacterized protein n=1 Tax=Corynebacterium phocae TaxID=161895 RepID=A0A1L7D1Z7_9CORY|nr:hypothetical protein CPHO_03600 [Corynebacterium phocae]
MAQSVFLRGYHLLNSENSGLIFPVEVKASYVLEAHHLMDDFAITNGGGFRSIFFVHKLKLYETHHQFFSTLQQGVRNPRSHPFPKIPFSPRIRGINK